MSSTQELSSGSFQVPHDWLVPDWPVSSRVRALCSTRSGGVSTGAFQSLNLGDHVADDPLAVQANRAIFASSLSMSGSGNAKPVFMQQVHGTDVRRLNEAGADALEGDASTTVLQGIACVMMVADCLPVLFTNQSGDQVAAAHAGWRGLAGGSDGVGVLEMVVSEFQPGERLFAWLGPCIGAEAFEVGAEVRAAFCDADERASQYFQALGAGKFLADLAGLARHRLRRAGVTHLYGNDSSAAWCTVSNPSRFFSYRRDQRVLGGSGRFAAAIWLDECG